MDEITRVIDHLRCMAVIMRTTAEEIDTLLDKEDLSLQDLHEGVEQAGNALVNAMHTLTEQLKEGNKSGD